MSAPLLSIQDAVMVTGKWILLIGRKHQQAIVSLAERKSRLSLIQKVDRKTSQQVPQTVTGLLRPVKHRVYTITANYGKEFADNETIASDLEAGFYFAHPYASWS